MSTDARTHIAWLLWCVSEGYVKAEDRVIVSNWLLNDPATLLPEDVATQKGLLEMADELLTQLRVCCPAWWTALNGCDVWTGHDAGGHGCKKDPGHKGWHVCPCGARKRQS